MLHVDLKMITRLDDIAADLVKRRERATDEGWLAEIEGIDLTLSFLRAKRDEAARIGRHAVALEVPTER